MSRLVTNSSALTVYKGYHRNDVQLAKSAERLATGLRVNRASDNAAAMAISESMRAQTKGTDMAVENIQNAVNFINTADGFLQNVNDILGRMEELAVEYTDDTKAQAEKANINVEFLKLSKELHSIATQRAKYNSANIFDSAALTLAVGADDGQTFTIAANDRNLMGKAAFTALASSNGVNITAGVAAVQAAIAAVSTFRATLGSYQAQLHFTQAGLESYSENIQRTESRIREVDVAKETTHYSRFQIQTQASTAILSQANSLPQNVLGLLS